MEEGPTSWWVLSCSIWVGLLVAQKGRLGRGDILHLLWGVCSASVFLHFILRVEPDFKVGALVQKGVQHCAQYWQYETSQLRQGTASMDPLLALSGCC